jgi:hypothetical protein
MAQAKAGKRQQRILLWFSTGGAIVAIFLGTLWDVPNDLWFLAMGAVGGLVGFLVGNLVVGRRSPRPVVAPLRTSEQPVSTGGSSGQAAGGAASARDAAPAPAADGGDGGAPDGSKGSEDGGSS